MELNPRNLATWIFLLVRKVLGKATVLWGHAWPRNGKESKSDMVRNLMRKLASKIIVYTDRQKEELKQKMPKKLIKSAPNAVFSVQNMQTDYNDNTINLIYVGRLVQEKKVDFLVRAFHKAIEHIPESVKLLIVGDGDEKENISSYIKQNNLQAHINLFGHINSYEQLKNLYFQSIFSISPGYVGLSVTQSFGFGVPMLVSKNENHSPEIEAVIENENAIFFKTNDENDFVDKLIEIYQNKTDWLLKRNNIVKFCKQNYSVEFMSKTFINLIK
jgi:glycosyltransferase involved in cell wall biosynthesis